MVNHVRTLLRNRAESADYSIPFAEYVPPTRSINLGGATRVAHQRLFGAKPDMDYIEYRLRQFMEVIHAGTLADYVSTFDRRITYLPFPSELMLDHFNATITPVGHSNVLYVGGAPRPAGESLHFVWEITKTSDSEVTIRRESPGHQEETLALDFISGLSNTFRLVGSDYTARFNSTAPDGSAWVVDVVQRPGEDVGMILDAMDKIGEPTILGLFGAEAKGDFAVFRRVWDDASPPPDRLAAILLALAYRIEELRIGRPLYA